jgi:hypothetical protein
MPTLAYITWLAAIFEQHSIASAKLGPRSPGRAAPKQTTARIGLQCFDAARSVEPGLVQVHNLPVLARKYVPKGPSVSLWLPVLDLERQQELCRSVAPTQPFLHRCVTAAGWTLTPHATHILTRREITAAGTLLHSIDQVMTTSLTRHSLFWASTHPRQPAPHVVWTELGNPHYWW